MKKLMMIALAACAAVIAGCRAVTVENYGEEIARDAENRPVTLADGRIQTVKKGWKVHHNQHWMNTTADSVTASVKPEEIAFAMNGLNSQPSEELGKVVEKAFDGGPKLVTAIGEAYVKIAGGGAQASTVLSSAEKIYEYFKGKGGDAEKATVTTTADNKVQVTDGTTCIQCDSAGNCTDCTPAK